MVSVDVGCIDGDCFDGFFELIEFVIGYENREPDRI